MSNRFGSLNIAIWDFIGIWYLEFDISEHFNTRDSISNDYVSVGYSTVKFHIRDVTIVFDYDGSLLGFSPSDS